MGERERSAEMKREEREDVFKEVENIRLRGKKVLDIRNQKRMKETEGKEKGGLRN